MENAAKSIIMVGGVIIGTMVMSIMIYLFSVFGTFSGEMSEKMNAKKYLQFNNNYFQYQGRIDITAQEIKSIINFTKEHNDSTGIKYGEEGFINISIDGVEVFNQNGLKDDFKNSFLEEGNSNFNLYACEAKINSIKRTSEVSDSELSDNPEKAANLRANYDFLVEYTSLNHGRREIEISKVTSMVKKIYFYKVTSSSADNYNLKNKEKCILKNE